MGMAHCILGKFLGVGCHCFPPLLDVPTSARCLHVQQRESLPAAEGGREMFRQIWPRMRLPRNSRNLLHFAILQHGTDGFTSPPKESLKILRLRPGLNPRTWVPKASTLPLDHRSQYYIILYYIIIYYVMLCCVILYYIILYYIILCCVVLFCVILCYIILYYIILYYIILLDHRRICDPSLTETSLCGAYLYMTVVFNAILNSGKAVLRIV